MRDLNVTIINASDATNQTSAAVDSGQLLSASFHAYFGDTSATGTLQIQASNDPTAYGGQATFTPVNWVNIPSASASVTAGGSVLITIPNMAYRWTRAVYTHSAGGTSTVVVNMNALSQ